MLAALDLVPASDTETRRRLLSIASRGLGDAAVASRWIQLAAAERDDDLRAGMLARLAALDQRQIPDLDACIRLFVAAVGPERTRALALQCLDRCAQHAPLVEAYRTERRADVQRLILVALARHSNPPPAAVELFSAALDACDADVKPLLVDRLLRAGALGTDRLSPLLRPSEPVAVRRRVLQHVMERSIVLEEAVAAVLARDPDAGCRAAAVHALAVRGMASPVAAEAVLTALRRDPSDDVRAAAAAAFEHALDPTPAAVDALLGALVAEQTTALARVIIGILTPHVSRSKAVQDALHRMLGGDLDADVAVLIYRTLGRLVVWDEGWLALFARAFADQAHDRVRAAILEALSGTPDPDDQLVALYHAALKAPEPRIREWGLRGLLLVSMDESRCATVAAAADVLLDQAIDGRLRLDVGRKIAAIPDKPAALVASLRLVAEQGTGELREVCRKAHDEAASAQGADAIDWDGWYRRVEVEQEVQGVFPDVFLNYDANPGAARRIMRAALAPDCSSALHESRISDSTILDFLAARNAIDDDISRYCVTFILTQESNRWNPNYHLALLKGNLAFPALKESVWQILDRRADVEPVLMREILIGAYRDEAEVARLVRERLLAKTNARQALPYLTFLAGNAAWAPAEAIITQLPPALVDGDSRPVLAEAYRRLKIRMPEPKRADGPGLADE